MIIFEPQKGTSLTDTVKAAIGYSKALYKGMGYGYIEVHFEDLIFGVNEKCTVEQTISDVYDIVRRKYQKHGGITHTIFNNEEYWIDKVNLQ